MAYVISPYAQPAILPRDNTGVQLVSEIAKAGYARRMKEMENKMKLQEEGKKAFDEAYKYAKLDLSKVDPAYHDELKSLSDNLGKNMVAAYQDNPRAFPNNTAIAEDIRRLNTLKTEYEALSSDIQKADDARRQLEKEGKFDITPTENRKILDALRVEKDAAKRKELFEAFKGGYRGGELDAVTLKVAPYRLNDWAQEVENLQRQVNLREEPYPQKEFVIKTVTNNPKKLKDIADEIGVDASTPEGMAQVEKALASYLKENKKPAPQGGGYRLPYASITKPTPGRVDFGMTTEKQGGGTMTAQSSVTAPAQITFSTAMPTTLVQPSVSYGLENGKTLNNDADFKDNKLFEVALSKVALLPVYKKGVTRKGGVDISGEIVDDLNLNDERLNGKYEYKVFAIGQGTKEVSAGSRGKELITKDLYIPINQVKDAVWDKLAQSEKQSVMENIFDMKSKAIEYNSKLKSPSSEKPAAEKPKGEAKEKPIGGEKITVIVDGKKGEISEDKWIEFKKKYPNATRQ
jgi:hypothetical protein